MGGGRKKKFIDKKAATTYNVVHRSQQDGAFGLEDRPSERVLLAQAPVNAARRARVTRAGFADDGYDYERHLRAGGGGVFVGADGSVSKAAALPPEALPGEQELERAVEAVTLDDRLMDADVRDALFDDAAFEDCEELLDDFVIDASRPAADEPEEFDFDAHVARLIAAAEGAGDEDEDEDDASFDAAPPPPAAVDAAFAAAIAEEAEDEDEDDEDDEDDLDAGRIRLDDGAVLGAMLDEAIGGQAPPSDAAFLDPPPRDRNRAVDDAVSDDEPGAADRALDAFYAEQDAADRAREARFDCETVLTTLSTLDNRPSVIGAAPPQRAPPPSRAALRAGGRAAADRDADAASTASRATMARGAASPPPTRAARPRPRPRTRRAAPAKKETKLAWKSAAAEAPVRHAAAPACSRCMRSGCVF